MFVPHSEIDLKDVWRTVDQFSWWFIYTHTWNIKLNDGLNVPHISFELESISHFESVRLKILKIWYVCWWGSLRCLFCQCKTLTMRPEFMTSYTPYQAETSLEYFKFYLVPVLICDLTDMNSQMPHFMM